MPPIEGLDVDFDLGVEQVGSSPSNRLQVRFVLYADNALWRKLMKTKDLQLELLQCYLRLKKVHFVVCDKANVHTLTDPEQA